MKIAQITDLHLDDFLADYYRVDTHGNLLSVFESVRERGISNVVLSGDLGIPESHSWLFETAKSYRLNPLLTLGNHDKIGDFKTLRFLDGYLKDDGLYYAAELENVTCLFLDSSTGVVGEDQISWFKTRLRESNRHVLVFIHHPIYDCGDTTMDRLFPLQNRRVLQQILEESSTRVAVFCGHYHTVHEQHRGMVSQYVTPSTLLQFKTVGEQVEPESMQIGYRIIDLTDEGIHTEIVSI